ncbi:hypothetical protein OROGR_022232 [Orobanche gracilis]
MLASDQQENGFESWECKLKIRPFYPYPRHCAFSCTGFARKIHLLRRIEKIDMVSIRRRKLLGMCSGRTSLLAQLSWVNTPKSSAEDTKPVSVRPLTFSIGYMPKEETKFETGSGSSNGSASSPPKDHVNHFPEIKRRKRHRRKHIENQETCIMRGVYFKNLKWQAAIKVEKKQIHLGTVGSQEEAARLYDRAAFIRIREEVGLYEENTKTMIRKASKDAIASQLQKMIH